MFRKIVREVGKSPLVARVFYTFLVGTSNELPEKKHVLYGFLGYPIQHQLPSTPDPWARKQSPGFREIPPEQ